MRFSSFPDLNPNPVFEITFRGKISYANPALKSAFPDLESHPSFPECRRCVEQYAAGGREAAPLVLQSGGKWYQFSSFFAKDLDAVRFYGMDITERVMLEETLSQINATLEMRIKERIMAQAKTVRLYKMLFLCNQALAAATDEVTLVQTICGIVVEEGGYRTAWVGFAEQDERRSVRPVASVGLDMEMLRGLGILWADVEKGRGLTGMAIRENRAVIWGDLASEPLAAPWRAEGSLRELASSVSFPLAEKGMPPFGAMTLGSSRPLPFDDSELTLLGQLAADLSYGIVALRARVQRDAALESLELKNRQLHRMTAQLAAAEQSERRQLAEILHDDLQQVIVGARLKLEGMNDERAGSCLELLDRSLQITRSLTAELCPPILYQGNLGAVLEWLVKWSSERYGLEISYRPEAEDIRLGEDVIVLVYRAVRELLFNIAKHARTKWGDIFVNVRDGRLQVSVRDAGAGFDPLELKKDYIEGGFGLLNLQERLKSRGCELHIESSKGKGSVMTIIVPLSAEVRSGTPVKCMNDGRRIRIIIVDDHAVLRQGLSAVLGLSPDIEVVGEAENGKRGIDLARDVSPDVVLMDIEMPVMNGICATRVLHGEFPDLKIIGLSMHEADEVGSGILDAGAAVFLKKSLPTEQLMKAIRSVHGTGSYGVSRKA